MVSAESARTVVGIIGNIICYFFYLSPVPTFAKIWKKRSVEQYSAFPYLAALMSCFVWTLYSLPMVHPGSTLVLTVSTSGVVIESIYVVLFLIFSGKQKRLKVGLVLLVELLFTAFFGFMVLTNFIHFVHEKRSFIVGVICVFSSVVMYSSPLAIMKLVITTKSVEYMPILLSLASFVNNLTWIFYALLRFDPYIVVPNGLGLFFGSAQLILYAMYYKSTKQIMEARKSKEIDCSNVVVVAEDELKKMGNISTQNNGHDDSDYHEQTQIFDREPRSKQHNKLAEAIVEYSPTPYLATLTLINCMLALDPLRATGIAAGYSLLVPTSNVVGIFIESVYIFLLDLFGSDKKMRLKVLLVLLVELIFTALLGSVVFILVHTHAKRSMIVGIICIFFTTLMYSSPLAIMKQVITTKSVEFMPFYLSLATFGNGLIWTAYALMRFDPIIAISSGLGSLFGLAQLIVYDVYYKPTKELIEARREREASLSTVIAAGSDKC